MSRLDCLPLPEHDITGGRVTITSPYGMRWGRLHAGVDLGTTDGIEAGTTVHAPADGTMVHHQDDGPKPSAGLNLWFQADDGRRWKCFHLSAVTVPDGTHVRAGQVIARVGMTGTDAPHLHLEEHVGSWSNPVDLTADVRECMTAGRFPGAQAPYAGPVLAQPAAEPHHQEDDDMAPPAYRLPSGEVYVLVPAPDEPRRLAWHNVSPVELGDLQRLGVVRAGDPIQLAQAGTEELDASFERFAVLDPPAKARPAAG